MCICEVSRIRPLYPLFSVVKKHLFVVLRVTFIRLDFGPLFTVVIILQLLILTFFNPAVLLLRHTNFARYHGFFESRFNLDEEEWNEQGSHIVLVWKLARVALVYKKGFAGLHSVRLTGCPINFCYFKSTGSKLHKVIYKKI